MAYENAKTLEIDDDWWEETGSDDDPSSRLLGSLCINGVYHHLEAYAVTEKKGMQEAADLTFEEHVEGMFLVGQPDKAFQTVEIRGRQYVLTMTPFC